MDNPAASLFQGNDININNSQNNEEEEELEDQLRRREELQNLLTVALDEYEDSTVNSSTNISAVSVDDVHQNYRNATTPSDQLEVLYNARMREINNLKEEYNNYKTEKTKETDQLKNKLILCEAEMRQLQIGYKNAESLLVEKTERINYLEKCLQEENEKVKTDNQIIEQYDIEMEAYKTTINELHLKLQEEKNPFNSGARVFQSEELQKAHQDQILRLESQLLEQSKKADNFEQENFRLKDELNGIIKQTVELENDNKNRTAALINSFESAQQQCKDLLDIVDMLTKENAHYKERLSNLNEEDDVENNSKEPESSISQCEKLKKMLLDKSIEINSLQGKLTNYEGFVDELLQFRQIKNDVLKRDIIACENNEHVRNLLIMQNEIKNLSKTLEDRDKQILNLNSINKELQDKIEDMIMQTRNDIQILSHKYSLPQLEAMSRDLKLAEKNISELEMKLQKSLEENTALKQSYNEKQDSLYKHQLEKAQQQIVTLQKLSESEKENFEQIIKMIQKDLDKSQNELVKIKQLYNDLKSEKENFNRSRGSITKKRECEQLKEQLNQVVTHLKQQKALPDNCNVTETIKLKIDEIIKLFNNDTIEKQVIEEKLIDCRKNLDLVDALLNSSKDKKSLKLQNRDLNEAENKIKILQETVEELTNAKIIAEGSKYTLETQLEQAGQYIKVLENEISNLRNKIKDNEANELENLIIVKDDVIKNLESEKIQLSELLEGCRENLRISKEHIASLENKLHASSEKAVRRNLEKEINEVEIQSENLNSESFIKNRFESEILTAELQIREEIQKEYEAKLTEVERKYQDICKQSTDLYKQQVEKTRSIEQRCMENIRRILAECSQKLIEVEKENELLLEKLETLKKEYNEFRTQSLVNEEKYTNIVLKVEIEAEKKINAWKNWSKVFVTKSMDIEKINRASRQNVIEKMKKYDLEVEAIEKQFSERISKKLSKK